MAHKLAIGALLGFAQCAGLSLAQSSLATQVIPEEAPSDDARLEAGRLALRGEDFTSAFRIFQELAKMGHAPTMGFLGEMFEQGMGVSPDKAAAARLYRRGADAGDIESLARLGFLLVREAINGVSAPIFGQSISRPSEASSGISGRPVRKPREETTSIEVKPALVQGLELLQEAISAGGIFAKFAMGTLMIEGMVVPRDEEGGLRLIEAAAAGELTEAQSALGRMYRDGRLVGRHEGMAVELLIEAARQGDVVAQVGLGALYRNGTGVERDAQEAAYWYGKAVDRGDAQAMGELGAMLLEGGELRADAARAAELLNEAARRGHLASQFQLGVALAEGRGVPQDRSQGFRWIKLAAERGFAPARQYLQGVTQ